jgi:hypothetical protein
MTSRHYHDCMDEARRAYRAGRYREAALDYQRAKNEATALGEMAAAFTAAVRAAEAWTLAGRPLRAYELLAAALTDPPPDRPDYEYWVALKRRFELKRYWRPDRQALAGMLDRLAAEGPALAAAPHDIPMLQAGFARGCGDDAAAIRHFERAYAQWRESADGFYIFPSLFYLCLLTLRCGDGDAAARWAGILENTETNYSGSRIWYLLAVAHLALWRDRRDELTTLRRRLADLADGADDPAALAELAEMQARLLLLIDRDDPADPLHPARGLLRRRAAGRRNVYTVYERRLLLLDYRLAELRFAAGIAPCDDYWHRHPSPVAAPLPCPLGRAEALRRADKARRALHRAAVYARWLDGCWESDFRQAEVAARAARINDIAAALPPA